MLPVSWRHLHDHNDGSKLFAIPCCDLLPIKTWSGNRYLDLDHVQSIRSSIKDVKELDGPFTIAAIKKDDEEDRLELIDGQHRRHVRCYNKDGGIIADDKSSVLIRLYRCESETSAVELFEKINSSKPMKYRHSAESKCHKYVEILKIRFPGLIRSGNTPRPFIREEELRIAIRDSLVFRDGDLGPSPDIFAKITEEINSTDLLDHASVTESIKEKAARYKFYLGIDRKFTWIFSAYYIYETRMNPLGI
jgi:hypothetical protein